MKTIRNIIVCVILIAAAVIGFWLYMRNFKSQIIKEQREIHRREELLKERIAGIQDGIRENNDSLLDKIDSLMAHAEYHVDSGAIEEEIREIGELSVLEYRYTNAGTIDASKKLFRTDIDLPGTKKTVVVTMDGIIKIGIDLSDIKVKCDDGAKVIAVCLPKPKLLSNELDEKSLQVYNEFTGIFTEFTMEDSSLIRSQIKTTSEKRAMTEEVLEQAAKNARSIVRCILESVPHLKEEYSVRFE